MDAYIHGQFIFAKCIKETIENAIFSTKWLLKILRHPYEEKPLISFIIYKI